MRNAHYVDQLETSIRHGDRTEPTPPHVPTSPTFSLYPAHRELESALTTIESCTPLLNQTSLAARRAALQVIAAQCQRSHRLLQAMKVLTDSVAMRRALLKPADLFTRLGDACRDEQRLVGFEPTIHVHADPQLRFYGDDDLLLTAMTHALSALAAAGGDHGHDLTFTASGNPASGTAVLELTDRSVVLPETFVRTAFTNAWPVPDGDTVLFMLQAARRIVAIHNGSMTLFSDPARTTVRLQLPADQLPRPN